MAITINFNVPLNESLQIGDTAYHSTIVEEATFDRSATYIEIGPVTSITPWNGRLRFEVTMPRLSLLIVTF